MFSRTTVVLVQNTMEEYFVRGKKVSEEEYKLFQLYMKAYYQKNKDRIKTRVATRYQVKKDECLEYNHQYYVENKGRILQQTSLWKSEHPDIVRISKAKYQTLHREEKRKADRERDRIYRIRLIKILGGPRCTKCGYDKDVRALQFAHVRNDGAEDRKLHTGGLIRFYVRNPQIARSNLTILCCNCNWIAKYEDEL